MTITLATTWVPRGELARIERYLPTLHQIYDDVLIVMPADAAEVKAVQRLPDVRHALWEVIGEGRYLTLQHALEGRPGYIHYADMDRLVRWVETHPDELAQTVAAIQNTDYVMIGRTPAAFDTHPQALQQTEMLIHRVFSHVLGGAFDFCSGSKGLSAAVVEYILAHGAKDFGLGTDTEWAVLAQRGGFTIGSILVDGLDWETADRFRDSAADPETQRHEAVAYDVDPANWHARVTLAYQIINAGLQALI